MSTEETKQEAPKLKTYNVTLPISGVLYTTVEAESAKDAIQKALASEDITIDMIEEWSTHERIVEGNVFHGMQNKAEAEAEDGSEDSEDDDE